MDYQPDSTAVKMRSIDIWRVKDGELFERWDELNLLEVFQQTATGTVRKAKGQ
jgi:predicted SnoaL-like aldol condensation-catalyzing enzyme